MNLNPKPGPNKIWQANSSYINSKIKTILGLLVLFSIGLGLVYGLTLERKNRQLNVVNEIQSTYGSTHTIKSPFFTSQSNPSLRIHPKNLNINVSSTHQERSRGIFKVPVYTADVIMTGNFSSSEKRIYTHLTTSNTKDILKDPQITINNTTKKATKTETNIYKTSNTLPAQINHNFTIKFQIQGTKELFFDINPDSKNNNIQINSSWPYPSFQSPMGTSSSQINQNGFTAEWNFTNQRLIDPSNLIGYKLFEPNDIYTKTDRSIKYGICVIALVFFSFMIVELLSGTKVNNIQYILVGLSLIVYYSLLLSLAEIIGFNLAYLLASAATISLNSTFVKLIIKRSKYSLAIGGLLSIIYSLIFLLLQTTQYTLLLGSISAYTIIGASMFATHFINLDESKN